MEFKNLIKQRRSQIGATLEDIAKIVGVSRATVLRWENGEIENIKRDKIANLAIALKCSPAYLMGWEDEPTPSKEDYPIDKRIELTQDELNVLSLFKHVPDEKKKDMLTVVEQILKMQGFLK